MSLGSAYKMINILTGGSKKCLKLKKKLWYQNNNIQSKKIFLIK